MRQLNIKHKNLRVTCVFETLPLYNVLGKAVFLLEQLKTNNSRNPTDLGMLLESKCPLNCYYLEIRRKLEEDNKSSGFPDVKNYLNVQAVVVMQFSVGAVPS